MFRLPNFCSNCSEQLVFQTYVESFSIDHSVRSLTVVRKCNDFVLLEDIYIFFVFCFVLIFCYWMLFYFCI